MGKVMTDNLAFENCNIISLPHFDEMQKVRPIKLSYIGSYHPSELCKLIDFKDVEQLTLNNQSYTLFLELYGTLLP